MAHRVWKLFISRFSNSWKNLNEKSHKSSKEINEVRVKSRHVEFRQQQTEPIKKERGKEDKDASVSGSIFLGKSSLFAQHSFFTDKSQEKPLSKDLQSLRGLLAVVYMKLFFLSLFLDHSNWNGEEGERQSKGCR